MAKVYKVKNIFKLILLLAFILGLFAYLDYLEFML